MRGSGCDATGASKELPLPVASPPSSPMQPAVQVRQYSFRPFSKERNVSDIRREYVHLNVRNNHNFSVLPRQEPHVARVSLLDVVRKVGRSERLKGKQITETTIKDLHNNREKVMTSSYPSRQNSECNHPPYFVLSDNRKHGGMKIDNISPSENARSTLTQLKGKEKVGKGKCQNHGHSNYDVTENDRISSNDVTNLGENVNKLVAKKRHRRVGRSFITRTGVFEYMGSIYNQMYINLAFILVILTSVIKKTITINSPKQLRIAGLPSARRQERVKNNSHAAHLFHPRLLRTIMIVGFCIESSSYILKVIFGKQKQRITRDRAVFKNTLISNGTILTPATAPPCCCISLLKNIYQGTFLAGKYLKVIIFLFAALYASYPNYFIIYAINLDSAISFTAF